MDSASIDLSSKAKSLWAKTGKDEWQTQFSPLYVHMGDSGAIARHLWKEWLPTSIKRMIADSIGLDDKAAECFVSWLATVHDIGKATPVFQSKNQELAERVKERGLDIPSFAVSERASHACMSEVLLKRWIERRHWIQDVDGQKYCIAHTYSVIVGGHHGQPPSTKDLSQYAENSIDSRLLGDVKWGAVQDELLNWAWSLSGAEASEDILCNTPLVGTVQMVVTGLVIMSDWIASNTDYFPLVSRINNKDEFRERSNRAWKRVDLLGSWHPVALRESDDELFHNRFHQLPANATLRPVQKEALSLAVGADNPCMIVIETVMGDGKTEAALLCAEILASKFCEGGVAYLLPTMATSNAMFARVKDWLACLPDDRGDSSRQSIRLAHSKAALNKDYEQLIQWHGTPMGDSGEMDDASRDENALAHQWFGGSKKALLASFVVGTVDQLLMAALQTKHIQLRHLGLAGKVVVVDEVHAYDAYMNTYLDKIIYWLGLYGVPIVLLSATLPPERRNQLFRAYKGCLKESCEGCKRRQCSPVPSAPRLLSGEPVYPLITRIDNKRAEVPTYVSCEFGKSAMDVEIEYLPDDEDSLITLLEESLQEGGCACVLRDTVGRAQQTYKILREKLSIDVKLVHSRFSGVDRVRNDDELLLLLGPKSERRPSAFVVVGTQVIEQSLDIDFDLLITDIAPVDLLLQRIGRLHRHPRGANQNQRPPRLRTARCYITGVDDWSASPPHINSSVSFIYPKTLLWRTIASLNQYESDKGKAVSIPTDIAPLVEEVYDKDEALIPSEWLEKYLVAVENQKQKRDKQRARAKQHLLGTLPRVGNDIRTLWIRSVHISESESKAVVRDSQESIEVVVVQCVDGDLRLLPWVAQGAGLGVGSLGDGTVMPDDDAARIAASCTVGLPPALAIPGLAEQVIIKLEELHVVSGWQESRWLKGALPLVLDENCSTVLCCGSRLFELNYSKEYGLCCNEENREGA